MNQPIRLFLCIIIWIASIDAQKRASFLIINNPAAADLFNQYEQRLSADEKSHLAEYTPFEIVEKNTLMGDQITHGMRLSYQSATYYLLRDDNGSLSGLSPAASGTFYSNCSIYYDTVRIGTSSLRLYPRHPSKGTATHLKKGETLYRIFSYRGATYIMRFTNRRVFGWIPTVRSSVFQKIDNSIKTAVPDAEYIHQRIMKHLTRINDYYDTLFNYFNKKTGQARSTPAWISSQKGNQYQYTLHGTPETLSQLSVSTKVIIREIRQMIIGKPFSVSYNNNIITITPRKL